MNKIQFYRVEKKFQEIILNWFEMEHVQEFYYGDGLQNTLKNLDLYCQGINNNGDYSFDHWIAFIGVTFGVVNDFSCWRFL